MPIKIGNFASDLTNVAGGLLKGKSEEETTQRAEALRERLAKVEEDKLAIEQQRLAQQQGEDNLRHSEQLEALKQHSRTNDLAEQQFQFATGKDKRQLEEQHLHEAGARERLKQLVPGVKGVDQMGGEDLQRQIDIKMNEQARVKEIDEQRKYDLSRQLEQVHRLQEMANTNMLTIRRYLNDTITRIQTDPSLARRYGEMLKAKIPNAMAEMVKQVSGRDLDAEYKSSAMQVVQASQQAFVITGNKAGNGPSPLAQKAVTDALPFAFKAPEEQARITADFASKIKNGQPIDMKAAQVAGIPIDSIAAQVGVQIDPVTGMSTKVNGASPSAPSMLQINQSGVQPEAGGRGMAALAGSIFGPSSPSTPAGPQDTSVAPDPMSGQIVHLQGSIPAGASGSWQAPPPVNSPAPVSPPPSSTLPSSLAQSAPAQPSPVNSSLGDAAVEGEQPGRFQRMLSMSRSLPEAEQSARALLDMGMDYNQVINSAPPSFQTMLSAKLPKRIPTRTLPPAPPAAPLNPFAQPNFAPSFGGIPSTSRPLFTPPDV